MYASLALSPPSLVAPPTPAALCAQSPSLGPCQPGGALFCQISPSDASCIAPSAAVYSGTHWGLMAAAVISAFVIYKFATH